MKTRKVFRKKPVAIEAEQFYTNNEAGDVNMNDIVDWINSNGGSASHNGTDIHINTLEGIMTASVGDWIIKGIKGEFYPCKHDIFVATYEEVSDSANTKLTGAMPEGANNDR